MSHPIPARAVTLLSTALALALTLAVSRAESASSDNPTTTTATRPAKWAQPVAAKHLTNFYKVTDNLYRCAQPDEDGLREAKALGIRTVINLRFFHADPTVTTGTEGMAAEHIASNAWHVEDEDVVKFLRLVSDEKNGPFLVHCQHGSDRTGVNCAMLRIVMQGWGKASAIDEMTHGGYGFHHFWTNIVEYVRDVDIERIRRQVEKTETPKAKLASGVSGKPLD